MDFLNKPVEQQWYPYNLQGSPLNIMYTLKFWESPNTDDLEFQTSYYFNISGFVYKSYKPHFSAIL